MERRQLSRWMAGAIGVGVLCGAAAVAQAQEREPGEPVTPTSPWRYETEVYAVLPVSTTTDLAVGDRMATIEGTASEAAALFRGGLSLRVEAWYRRYGLIFDGSYIQIADDRELPGENQVGVSARSFELDILAGIRALEYGGAARWPSVSLELHAGIRGEYVEGRIGIGELMSEEQDAHLKLAGAIEVPVRISERWWLRARTTVASRHGTSVSVLAHAEYDFAPAALALGYQYDVSESESARLDIETDSHNIYLAFMLRFAGEG